MGQCNAQTNDNASGVVTTLIIDQSTARLTETCAITKKEPASQTTPRGLELIKSCAKFYANGVGERNPRPQLSERVGATLNQPATQASPSRRSKAGIRNFAVMCSFLLILPSLSLATIVWW